MFSQFKNKHINHKRIVVYATTLKLAEGMLYVLAHSIPDFGQPINRGKFATLDHKGGVCLAFGIENQPTRFCADFIYFDRDLSVEQIEYALTHCRSGELEYFN